MNLISNQLHAIAKLDNTPHPLFKTWSTIKLAVEVEDIFNMFVNETNLKCFIGGKNIQISLIYFFGLFAQMFIFLQKILPIVATKICWKFIRVLGNSTLN